MEIMRRLLFLICWVVILHHLGKAQDATYMVAIYNDTTTVLGFPAGITDSDIEWSVELKRGGETCSKSKTDQSPVWIANPCAFQLNLSIFTSCSIGGSVGWLNNDVVTLTMTINKPGHPYHGVQATSTISVQGGMNAAVDKDGIIWKAPKPTMSVDNVTLCDGVAGTTKATLTNAPTGYTIDWGDSHVTTDGTPTATQANAKVAAGLSVGTHNLTAKLMDGANAVATANYTVTVKALPTVSITPTQVCPGMATTLTANPAGATSYGWSGLATGNGRTKSVTLTTGGDVTVEVTQNGCKNSATQTITVLPRPTVTIQPLAKTDMCVEEKLTLTANASGGSGTPYTYTWSPAGGTTSTKEVTIADGANKFSVTVKDKEGCESNKSTEVTVTGHKVTAGLSAEHASVPNGGSTTLTATPAGALSYTWSGSSVTGTGATVSTGTLSSTGTYTVEVKDNYGCTGTATTTVRVSGGALAANPENKDVCSGNLPISLSAEAEGGSGTYTYEWTAPAGVNLSSTTAEKPTVANTSTPGTYTVHLKVTDTGTKGTVEKDIQLVIKQTPQLSGEIANPSSITIGESSQLSVTVNPTTSSLKWSGGPLASSTGATVQTGALNSTTTYTVEADNEGCKATKQVTVDVAGAPGIPTLSWEITEKVCQYPGETRTITLKVTGGSAGMKYSFVLSAPDGSVAKTVNQETNTEWTHIVTQDKKGKYELSKFEATLAGGTTVTGNISPSKDIDGEFYKVPLVYAHGVVQNSTLEHCEGEELILSGSGDDADYTWNNGVQNGQPFLPTVSGVYEVTGTNGDGCSATDQVMVNLNPKPQLDITVSGNEICPGEEVILSATADLGTVTWDNGVTDGAPLKIDVSGEHKFTATATDPATGCMVSKDTVVVVKEKPSIVSHSKNPRNIAIGKDVYFAVKATGDAPLTYEWYRKESDTWTLLTDNSVSLPTVSGATTDSLILQAVPESWDGSELKVVVKNDCDTVSMIFQLGVKECFEIEITLLMQDGIIPDTDPANKIDGWYCRNRRIALRAELSSPEGYDIENGHYKWTIDGLELPEEHLELVTDTCVLTWIPEFQEDDIVIKVCGYSDGACEEVCSRYLRLKAREFEKVSLDLLTSVDPDHRFCPGDTVDFWVAAKNVGDSAHYNWYNDIFHLPNGNNPNNELLSYSETKLTLVMGQEDTWMKVVATPSNEVCTEMPMYSDSVFLRKGQWVTPSLRIINNIEDTMACRGDRILFTAVYENAGTNPTFNWRKDVWDWGHEQFAEAVLDDKDMWLKCWLVPGNDVCYDGSILVDSMVIRVLENPTVVISADLTNKAPGDEVIIESEVTNMPSNAHYTWYLNYDYTLSNSDYPEYISDKLAQGDVIQCGVTGERICTSEVLSNELVIYFGDQSRDTMITIYQGEKIHNLNMRRKGDTGNSIFRITADGYPRWGIGSMKFNGHFDYTPNAGFVGSDVVKYEVVDKFDATKVETGYIYISVLDRKRFFIPNIITPNGDGLNDTWNLEFLADYPDHHITIYNRDGVVVFEATNYQNDWDGTGTTTSGYVSYFNLANGVYTYVIDLGNKEILKNWIEIRRDMNRGKYRY